MKYKKELDGLRAIAVLAVIFYHAGFKIFSGGFFGVDIFFVISGYLITTILIEEIDSGKFSFLRFYERRARRILPALYFVMLSILPFAWNLMPPDTLTDFSKSLIAVPLFFSNVLFSLSTGYFDVQAELKPLLHTWSLAVEEQFYLLFPIFLLLGWKMRRENINKLLFLFIILSLLVAEWGSNTYPSFSFYLLPTRCFELLIGAFIAFRGDLGKDNLNLGYFISNLGSLIGLSLILISIFILDSDIRSPGFISLLPTIGAGLVIVYAGKQNIVGKILGNKVFTTVGLCSYSAYLWHHPIIALAKLRSLYVHEDVDRLLIVLVSLSLGYISWRFIERPFRDYNYIKSKVFFSLSFVISVLFIASGFIIKANNGFRDLDSRVPPNVQWLSLGEKLNVEGDICTPKKYKNTNLSVCFFGDLNANKKFVLYGDSHAQALGNQLNLMFSNYKIMGIKVVIEGCEVVPELRLYKKDRTDTGSKCVDAHAEMLEFIKEFNAKIILASRWTFKLFPISGEVDDMPSKNSEGGVENESYREYVSAINGIVSFSETSKREAINNFLSSIILSTDKLFLVYPTPEISWDISRLNISFYRRHGFPLDEISIPYDDFKARNKFINSIFNEYRENSVVVPIIPELIFCNTFVQNRCVAQYRSIPFYYDDDHLSDVGAYLIVRELIKKF